MTAFTQAEQRPSVSIKNIGRKRLAAGVATALNTVFALTVIIVSTISASQLFRKSNDLGYAFVIAALGAPWPLIFGVLLAKKIKKITYGYGCHELVVKELFEVQSTLLFLCYFILQFLVLELSNAAGVILRLGLFGRNG
jgi:hypothetical protein